jgi:hypothetical protein
MTKYRVSGPHGVNDTAPGEIIDLDPEDVVTLRLLERGQISRQLKPPANTDDEKE